MNRSQLLNELAERNEWTRREADAFLTSFTDLITATVSTGEDVAISGFAKFRRIDRPARMARNPATGEQVKVAAEARRAHHAVEGVQGRGALGQEGARQEGSGEEDRGQEGARQEGSGEEDRAKKAPAKKKAAAKRR